MTTIGELISELYSAYERAYGDDELAAVATQVRICELVKLPKRPRSSTRGARRG